MNFGAKHGNESALSRSRNLTERKGAFERASTALLGEEALQPSSWSKTMWFMWQAQIEIALVVAER
jgi:hypothetical protein